MTTTNLTIQETSGIAECTQDISTSDAAFKCVYYYNVFCASELDCKDCKMRKIRLKKQNT